MSVGGSQEVRRCIVSETVGGDSGLTENFALLEAMEDRELLGVLMQFSCPSGDQAAMVCEVSFSASAQMIGGNNTVDSSRNAVVAVSGTQSAGSAVQQQFNLPGPIEWQAGEEVNIHVNNDVTGEETFRIILYYREV